MDHKVSPGCTRYPPAWPSGGVAGAGRRSGTEAGTSRNAATARLAATGTRRTAAVAARSTASRRRQVRTVGAERNGARATNATRHVGGVVHGVGHSCSSWDGGWLVRLSGCGRCSQGGWSSVGPCDESRTGVRHSPRTLVRCQVEHEQLFAEQMFDVQCRTPVHLRPMTDAMPSSPRRHGPQPHERQREILEVIDRHMRERGYPPSVREIGEAVGLTSPRRSTTTSPPCSAGASCGVTPPSPEPSRCGGTRRPTPLERRPSRSVPLVGDVAAGTDVLAQENVEELLPLPAGLRR